MTTSQVINGLKHTADDHPCCRETMEATIKKLELWEKLTAVWEAKQRESEQTIRNMHEAGSRLLARIQALETELKVVRDADCILGTDTDRLRALKQRAHDILSNASHHLPPDAKR